MEFKINNFIVYTDREKEELNEQIAVPTKIKNNKPSEYEWEYKTRDLTVFKGLLLLEKRDGRHYSVINDLFDFIDLIELLKAFSSKKLDVEKEYNINNKAAVKITQKDGKKYLSIHFTNYSYILYLDKFECTSYAAKFSKILSRCEAWQEQVQ